MNERVPCTIDKIATNPLFHHKPLFMNNPIEKSSSNDLFHTELGRTISIPREQDVVSKFLSRLGVDENGSIAHINEVQLSEKTSGRLTYLLGSLNFLFNLINEETEGVSPENAAVARWRKEVISLQIDMLSELCQASSQEAVNSVIERVRSSKDQIKKELIRQPAYS
jgi:hypothetical protein